MARWRLNPREASRALTLLGHAPAPSPPLSRVLASLERLGVRDVRRELVVKRHAREARGALGLEQLVCVVFASGIEEAATMLEYLEVSEHFRAHGIVRWRGLPAPLLRPLSAERERFLEAWRELPEASRRQLKDRRWRSRDVDGLFDELRRASRDVRSSRRARGPRAPVPGAK